MISASTTHILSGHLTTPVSWEKIGSRAVFEALTSILDGIGQQRFRWVAHYAPLNTLASVLIILSERYWDPNNTWIDYACRFIYVVVIDYAYFCFSNSHDDEAVCKSPARSGLWRYVIRCINNGT